MAKQQIFIFRTRVATENLHRDISPVVLHARVFERPSLKAIQRHD